MLQPLQRHSDLLLLKQPWAGQYNVPEVRHLRCSLRAKLALKLRPRGISGAYRCQHANSIVFQLETRQF
jgi:hypothetical protein